jgi:putative ABC transport system permease protein
MLIAFTNALPGNIAQGLIWGIMALGVYITFKVLNFADMTVDGSFATGGAVAVMMILSGKPVGLALLLAAISGVLAGILTGVFHVLMGIPDILAGILTQFILYSLNLNIMGAANKAVSVTNYPLLLSLRFVTKSIVISAIFVAAIVILLYIYFGTEQGSALRATGNNPQMSKAQGINIGGMKILGLAFSNGLVALSGGLFAQYQGFSDINMGRGSIVIGLAAVIIGDVIGSAIFGKRMNFMLRLIFVVLGAILYYIVIGLVLAMQFPSDDLKLFTALVVAIFMGVPYIKDRIQHSYKKAGKGAE